MPELNRRKKVPFLFIFLVLFLASSSSAQENFFPFKNKASQVVAEVTVDRDDTSPGGTAGVTVDVTIPLKHHAYLDRGEKGFYIPVEFDFSKLGPLGIEVNKVSVPEGKKDEDFGATVLRGTGRYEWDFSSKDMINFDSLPKFKISYQVCNDETKICFPPGSLFVSFTESGAETAKVEEPEPVKPETESEADGKGVSEVVSDKFKQYSTNFFLSFFIILAAGLLAAGTPCVYPMLPITCTILMNRGKGSKTLGNYHTISYFLGIVFIYILLGYLAGMTGGAFSTFMRSATVNLFFSFLFILLGLAMLGFFQMSVGENFIAGLSSAAGKKESLSGTFLMGATAGLIISPCVGPVVFTLLMSVADKIAEANALAISAGEELSYFKRMLIAGKGGVLMGGFGIGIGIPFLLAGFFSNKMPRSGTWMNYIKYIFSVIIFYVAWVYYEKGMHTAKIPDDSAYTIMAAVVLLLFAIKLGAFRTEESRYKKAASFLLLFLSLISGYHGLLKSGLTTASKTNGTAALKEFETHGNLRWYRDYSKAKEMAVRTKTPMFIDFYADWCANCVEFGKLTLKNQKLNSSLKKVLLVKIYDTDPVFTTFQNKKEHRELKTGLPYFTILAPNETMLWEGTQYDAVGTMASQIEGALSKTD